MRIHRLRLRNYRGIAERDVAFAERGVTVVQGPNEIGKSSMAEALDLLLEYFDDSRHATVRAVKPVHADVGAEVEAELSAGPYRFTYFKRFHRQTATELRVHAPSPEHLTGREAHERVRAMLAETVDLALWRALRIGQTAAVGQPDLTAVRSLAAALDLAAGGPGGGEGGERELGVLERVQAEYTRYFTPTGQDNAWLKGLRAEAEAAAGAEDEARAALHALEADVERCAAIARDLEALRPEYERHATQLADLETRWAEVERRLGEVERLELAAGRARDALREAERDAADRDRLAQAAEQAAQRAAALAAEREAKAPELDAAGTAEQAGMDEVTGLRERLAEARAAQRAAAEAEARARDAFSLELLQERWQRVLAAREQAAAARAELDGVRIDEAALEGIEAAHLGAAQARARLDDEVPVLRLRADRPVDVALDGAPLALIPGQTHEVAISEELRLRIGEVEARLSPGHGLAALRARSRDADQALAHACAAAGVTDLADARAALRRRRDAERQLDEADRATTENLRDLSADALEDKLRRLRERVGQAAPGEADVDAARRTREQAQALVRDLEERLESAEKALATAAERRAALRESYTGLAVRAEQADQEADSARQALTAARATESDESLLDRLRRLGEQAEAASTRHAQARAAIDADDPDSLAAAVENARAVAAKQRRELRDLEDELSSLRGRLSALGESGLHDRLTTAQTRRERAETAWRQAQRGAAAVKLLHDTLHRHREAARRAYAEPLRAKIEGLGRIVFGPDFGVELDDELRVARRSLDGVTLDVEQLSAGAREQLAVLTRLAVATLTAHDGGVPLLLDDTLGWSDPDRLERLGAAFHLAARDCQVIVLTCVPERYRHIGSATTVNLPSPRTMPSARVLAHPLEVGEAAAEHP